MADKSGIMNREDDGVPSEEEEFDWYLHRALIQMARAIERKYQGKVRYRIELIGVPRGREGNAPQRAAESDPPRANEQ